MSKPIWLLDVDGVVNVISRYPTKWPSYKVVKVQGFEIRYAQEVVDFINKVHASGDVEVRWLTTWRNLAASDLAPALGLDKFEVVPDDEKQGAGWYPWGEWWKLEPALDVAMEERPLIWTDDDLREEHVEELKTVSPDLQHLPIRPDSSEGLTPKTLKIIEDFIYASA